MVEGVELLIAPPSDCSVPPLFSQNGPGRRVGTSFLRFLCRALIKGDNHNKSVQYR